MNGYDEITCYDFGKFLLFKGSSRIQHGERTLALYGAHGSQHYLHSDDLKFPENIAVSFVVPEGEKGMAPTKINEAPVYPTYQTITSKSERGVRDLLLTKLGRQINNAKRPVDNFFAAVSDLKEQAAWAAHDHQMDIVLIKKENDLTQLFALQDVINTLDDKKMLSQFYHLIVVACRHDIFTDAKFRGIANNFHDQMNTPKQA